MPVLHVRALPQSDPSRVSLALKETCIAIAKVYGCQPSQVWATWEEIEPGFYVEGESSASQQPTDTHPPIAQLICFEGKENRVIEQLLLVAAKTLSSSLGIEGNVFITYNEAKSGQVVAGNGVLRTSSD